MKRISGDIFKEAVTELGNEQIHLSEPPRGMSNIPISAAVPQPLNMPAEAEGFHIGATPGALIGALTGAMIAGKKVKADAMRRQVEMENHGPSLNGNYYSQAQNIAKNLKVIFTPLGVIYTVKDGTRETTIDNIETSEMNRDMYAAWQHKDYEYFRGLMLTKMYSEMQVVEQSFAKRFVEKQQRLQGQISKKASTETEDVIDTDDLTSFELMEHIASTKDLFGKHTPTTEKIAELVINAMEDGTVSYVLPLQLERPFDKYAGFTSQALGFMGFNNSSHDIRSEQGKFLEPGYLASKVKIGFMPDRVVYTVDGKLVGTLLAMNMNEDGFEHFQKLDKAYFTNLFKDEVKTGFARMKGRVKPNSPKIEIDEPKKDIEKKAAAEVAVDNNIKQIFQRNDIHPVVYYLVLTKQYGFDWFNFDPHALVVIIERDFDLREGIDSIPLNKILSIQVANNSEACYESYHAFEKVMRSLCGKRVDFFKREISDMDIDDIAFSIDILDRVTPHDDIYDNFGPDLFDYLTNLIAESETYVYSPTAIVGSPTEKQFNEILNYSLLSTINDKMLAMINPDEKVEAETIKNNETIFDLSHMILDAARKQQDRGKINLQNAKKFIDIMLEKLAVKQDLRALISKQVIKNMALDEFLIQREQSLAEQLKFFGLSQEGSEG